MLLTTGCLGVVGGIGLVAWGWRFDAAWLGAAVILIMACRRRLIWVAVPAALLAGVIIGGWRGSQQAADLAGYQLYIGNKVAITGTVAEDSGYTDGQRDLMLQQVAVNGHGLPGKIRVKTLSPVAPGRGDVVEASGKLYAGFGSYQAVVYFAEVRVLATAQDPLYAVRQAFAATIRSLLPDTEAALGLGFLLGVKSDLPETLDDQLKVLGLTHVVVASGFNLTVLVRLARRIFAKSSHYQMTVACLALMIGFVVMAGFSPSLVRAGLVTGLCVVTWYYGRRVHPVLLLSLTAALTALVNPLYVWSDLGWWLSFLAFAGVMLGAPLVQSRLFSQRQPRLIGQIIIETMCAQLLTLPLILFIFGTFSVLSLPANVLVVPLVPLGMLLTFVAGLIGVFLPWLAWLAIWLLQYLTALVRGLASVPWASVEVTFGLPWLIASYAIIVGIGILLWHKTKHDYLSKSVIE